MKGVYQTMDRDKNGDVSDIEY